MVVGGRFVLWWAVAFAAASCASGESVEPLPDSGGGRIDGGGGDMDVRAPPPDDSGGPRDSGGGGVDARRPLDCPEGQTDCGGTCVDLRSTASSCGMCGRACSSGQVCQMGACASSCAMGMTMCTGGCVDLATSATSCGTCGHACGMGETCAMGSCTCPMGGTMCGGACADLQSNAMHCGACGVACGSDETCRGGRCACATGDTERDCSDGRDDDCDGLVDCADDQCDGATRPCTSGSSMGTQTCGAGGTWGACTTGGPMMDMCTTGGRRLDPYEPNDSCSQCHRIPGGPDVDVTIADATMDSPDDGVDCFVFSTDDGTFSINESIDVSLTNVPATADYDIYLYWGAADCASSTSRAYGNTGLAGQPDSIHWTERFGVEDGGDYYVLVKRFSGYSCEQPYSLHIRGLD